LKKLGLKQEKPAGSRRRAFGNGSNATATVLKRCKPGQDHRSLSSLFTKARRRALMAGVDHPVPPAVPIGAGEVIAQSRSPSRSQASSQMAGDQLHRLRSPRRGSGRARGDRRESNPRRSFVGRARTACRKAQALYEKQHPESKQGGNHKSVRRKSSSAQIKH